MASPAAAQTIPSMEGMTIAGYGVERLLATGPRGPSFRATRQRDGEPVVLKLLFDADKAWLDALEERLNSLTGADTAAVLPLDHGVDPDHGAWLVTPWHNGEDLVTYLDACCDRTLGVLARAHRLAGLIVAICGALKRFHCRGLVHGGLAPSKVVVTDRGSQAVLLLDAYYPTPGDLSERSADPADSVVPWAEYQAPEVLVEGREPDTRSDVWSLGALVLEALTGMTPWGLKGLSVGEVRERLIATQPLRPQTVDPEVHPYLKYFPVFTMFHLPSRRPAHAEEALRLLEVLMAGGHRAVLEYQSREEKSAAASWLSRWLRRS